MAKKKPPHSEALSILLRKAAEQMDLAKYEEAAANYARAYDAAKQFGADDAAAESLSRLGACQFLRFQYREALESYFSARKIVVASGDRNELAGVDLNVSSVYYQLGEFEAAAEAATRALGNLRDGQVKGRKAKLLILLANIRARQGKSKEAWRLFRDGILEADRFGDAELLSSGWDKLGAALLAEKKLPEAEHALLEAYRIRKLKHLPTLGTTYRNLGMLRLEQGDLRSAEALINASMTECNSGRRRIPEWRFYQARGLVRLAKGDLRPAYDDFRLAVDLIRNFRLEAPPSDATRVSLSTFLESVYASMVETGSRLYFQSPNPVLATETFEAAEENRAGSLAARLDERAAFRYKLPPAYWEALSRLEAAQSQAVLYGGQGPRQAISQIRASLIEMEVQAGGPVLPTRPNLLERVQRSLDDDTVLLAFHLSGASSLWAVSNSGLSLYRLPDRAIVTRQANDFRRAVMEGAKESERLGRNLYNTLFGALGPEYRKKSRWVLSLDGGMFDLPFAALVVGGAPGAPEYLVERHSLQRISGAAAWADRKPGPSRIEGEFVGVGDAIYNTADARWTGGDRFGAKFLRWAGWSSRVSAAAPTALSLSRLPGTGPEIEVCAREWGGPAALLQGREATKDNLRRALVGRPSILHFATHVLERPNIPDDGMIALSVAADGREELLGATEIGGWNADAGLVVLSGCSSGLAAARPGEGLMGLTRAWLMAGSRAVVASTWQTPDDVGVFFQHFYHQLRNSPDHDPARALAAAQIETIRSRDWRSRPPIWAAYFVVGNY